MAESVDVARKRSRSSSPSAEESSGNTKKANQALDAPSELEVDDDVPRATSTTEQDAADEAAAAAMQTDENGDIKPKDESAPMIVDSASAGIPAKPNVDLPANPEADAAPAAAATIQMRTLIVTQDASIIIGKQGKNVNEIRDKSGAKITITEAVAGNPERIMGVNGPLDAVSKVRFLSPSSSHCSLFDLFLRAGLRSHRPPHQRRALRRSLRSRFPRRHHPLHHSQLSHGFCHRQGRCEDQGDSGGVGSEAPG
jgi:hypothetical protein